MSEALLIAGGLGRAVDAAAIGMIVMGTGAVSIIWLLSMAVRKRSSRRELWWFRALWVAAIGLASFVWIGGRISDERHSQELDEWEGPVVQIPASE